MRTSRPLQPALLIAALAVLTACSTPLAAPAAPHPQPAAAATPAPEPAVKVDIRGRVVQAHRNGQGDPPVGTIVVEGPVEPDTRYAKASILIDRKSKVFVGRGGKRAAFAFIHSGDLVEVTFAGPATEATESDPVKATAAEVVILEHTP
jgi:hypothetical protein